MIKQRQKDTDEDLVQSFRTLAPNREPVSIQRWSGRRIVVAVTTLFAASLLFAFLISNLLGKGFL
jgi:hypothetical protein